MLSKTSHYWTKLQIALVILTSKILIPGGVLYSAFHINIVSYTFQMLSLQVPIIYTAVNFLYTVIIIHTYVIYINFDPSKATVCAGGIHASG